VLIRPLLEMWWFGLRDYLGKSVLLITGTDEHGQKEKRHRVMGDRPKPTVMKLQLGLLRFGNRTSSTTASAAPTASNHEAVKEFFQRVGAGDIYQGQQQGWYCVSCEEFKEEREL